MCYSGWGRVIIHSDSVIPGLTLSRNTVANNNSSANSPILSPLLPSLKLYKQLNRGTFGSQRSTSNDINNNNNAEGNTKTNNDNNNNNSNQNLSSIFDIEEQFKLHFDIEYSFEAHTHPNSNNPNKGEE